MSLREPDTLDDIEPWPSAPVDDGDDLPCYRDWKLRELISAEIMYQRRGWKGSNRTAEQRERDCLNSLLWPYGYRISRIPGWQGRRD